MSAIDLAYRRLMAAVIARALLDMASWDTDAARFISLEGGTWLEAIGLDDGADVIDRAWDNLRRPSYMRRFTEQLQSLGGAE